jgi:hypothetical protein
MLIFDILKKTAFRKRATWISVLKHFFSFPTANSSQKVSLAIPFYVSLVDFLSFFFPFHQQSDYQLC